MQINGYDVEESVSEDGVNEYQYFACTCDGEDKEFWRKALSEHLPDTPFDKVSALIMELTHCYNACVTGIGCDYWFGVSVSAGRGEWEDKTFKNFIYEKQCKMYIQCDEVVHGLLAAVMILKEKGYAD